MQVLSPGKHALRPGSGFLLRRPRRCPLLLRHHHLHHRKWGPNAEKRLQNPTKPVNRLRVQDLDDSPIDWSKFSLKNPQALSLKKKKTLRPHQKSAKSDVTTGLADADRGKLIMACGTGKTFTSLRTAEEMAPTGHVLFLVPSLSLLSQSLREWTAEAEIPMHALAVCSDVNIGKRSNRDAPGDDATVVSRVPLNNIFQPILPQAIPPLTSYLSFVHLNT